MIIILKLKLKNQVSNIFKKKFYSKVELVFFFNLTIIIVFLNNFSMQNIINKLIKIHKEKNMQKIFTKQKYLYVIRCLKFFL